MWFTIIWGVLMGTLGTLNIVAYRRRGERQSLVVIATCAVALLVAVAFVANRRTVPWPLDLAAGFLILQDLADTVGLPPSVARRIGFGFRSRECEYDRALTRVITDIQRAWAQVPTPDDGRSPATKLRDARRGTVRLRTLRAPDADWQHLTDECADAYEAWTDMLDAREFGVEQALRERLAVIFGERDRLRAKYGAEAAELIASSRAARLFGRRWKD